MRKTEDRSQKSEVRSQKIENKGSTFNFCPLFSVFCFLSSVFCLLSSVFVGSAQALKISDFYQDVKVGEWILMKSSDGLLTKTSVIAKGEGKVTLRIQSFQEERLISDSEQVVDVREGRVLSIRIQDQGTVKEIYPEKTETDDFFQIDFRPVGKESIAVEKGFFHCKRYKGIYKDRVVRAWIDDQIPVLHLVKISMQGVSVQLVDYGH